MEDLEHGEIVQYCRRWGLEEESRSLHYHKPYPTEGGSMKDAKHHSYEKVRRGLLLDSPG